MSISISITETNQDIGVTVNETTQAVAVAITESTDDIAVSIAEYGDMFKTVYDPAGKKSQIVTSNDTLITNIDCGTIT